MNHINVDVHVSALKNIFSDINYHMYISISRNIGEEEK